MLMKKKSLIVALISSVVVSSVLVLTLIGYVVYIELKGEEFRLSYQDLLQRVNAKVYSKHIEAPRLDAKIEASGTLKGKPVIEGVILNRGLRNIDDLLVKVKFLDNDGAVIYEVVFHPQEPALGSASLTQITIPYLSSAPKVIIGPGKELSFKRILINCPKEIILELREGKRFAKGSGRWSGKLAFEILTISFSN